MSTHIVALLAVFVISSVSRGALAQGSAEDGAILFQEACSTCHSMEPGRHMTGPSLASIWGRPAGTVAAFPRYSPALKSANLEWNDLTLDAWLMDPAAFVPGNFMPFEGLKNADARADIAVLLRAVSDGTLTAAARQILAQPGGMQPQFQDLKALGPDNQVVAIRHCRGMFHVTTRTRELSPILEFNLRFSSDTSPLAPRPGQPAILRSGMMGDRAHVFFADPSEISAFIRESC